MRLQDNRWLKLFLFCLGIAVGTTFIMQWLASDFWLKDGRFSIFGLELFYSKSRVADVLTQLNDPALQASQIALNYQLIFDFAFMAGVYPALASACMLVRERTLRQGLRNFLFALAVLQPVAWAFDVAENYYLLSWLETPVIGDEFMLYHKLVIAKWIIALTGGLSALLAWAFTKNPQKARG